MFNKLRLLVAALKNQSQGIYDLLLIERGQITTKYEHPAGWLRGFARFGEKLWTIDSKGNLFQVELGLESIALKKISTSKLAREAHDLTVIEGRLATAGPCENAIVFYDPAADQWSTKRPWVSLGRKITGKQTPDKGDRHHVNSLLQDKDQILLSFFTIDPKPEEVRWRKTKLDEGLIVRWGNQGFADQPLTQGVYAPHSLRKAHGHIWWCDSFRGTVCRDDGWRSPKLDGFARGLRIINGKCVVGLSASRVDPYPEMEICGIAVFDPNDPQQIETFPLERPYIEVYDLIGLHDSDFTSA